MERQVLDIQRDALHRYLCALFSLSGLLGMGVGVIGTWLAVRLFAHRWIRQWVDGLQYEIRDGVLWVRSSWRWGSEEKGIPLSKITNLTLSQNVIHRYFGIHTLSVQTAGDGRTPFPEARLRALVSPESVRDRLLARPAQ